MVLALTLLVNSSVFAAEFYRVNKGTKEIIEEFGLCKTIENNSSHDLFVPTKTKDEFSAFLTHTPNGIAVSSCCPDGYIRVPAIEPYTIRSFCVAKYEMKNVGGVATSKAEGAPWVNITRDEARAKCATLGTGYSLITNAQWQTIARNIEQVAANWSGRAVGSGALNRGHSDSSPNSSLPASTDDDQACHQTGQTCSSTTWHSQKRTHVLLNGEVIWDFSGNVAEWIYENASDLALSFNLRLYAGWFEYPQLTAEDRNLFGPSNSSWNSTQGIGLLYSAGTANGAILRGGGYTTTQEGSTGIYYANLNYSPLTVHQYFGFRCVFNPE